MLIVSRRAGESLLIGNEVSIEILAVSSTQVKLGIRAPREIPVFRREILLTMRQNEAAATVPPAGVLDGLVGLLRAIPAQTLDARPDKTPEQ